MFDSCRLIIECMPKDLPLSKMCPLCCLINATQQTSEHYVKHFWFLLDTCKLESLLLKSMSHELAVDFQQTFHTSLQGLHPGHARSHRAVCRAEHLNVIQVPACTKACTVMPDLKLFQLPQVDQLDGEHIRLSLGAENG